MAARYRLSGWRGMGNWFVRALLVAGLAAQNVSAYHARPEERPAGLAEAQEGRNVPCGVRDGDDLQRFAVRAIDDEVCADRPEQKRAGTREVRAGVPGVGKRREVVESSVKLVDESVGGISVVCRDVVVDIKDVLTSTGRQVE